jgi:hypothetical protein
MADGPEQREADRLEAAAEREIDKAFAELMAEDARDSAYLEELRKAGIPRTLEREAMASMRQARYVAKTLDAVFNCPHGAMRGTCALCNPFREEL